MSALHTALLIALLLGLAPQGAEDTTPQLVAFADEIALSALEDDAAEMLTDAGLHASISARIKTPKSLAAKAERKGLIPDAVLDRIGLRVQVDSVADCYAVLTEIHSRYVPVSGSQDDYIAHPKANGYQSLHTAVHTPIGIAEFQIRTPAMHAHAEHGGASHSHYKAAQRSA
ncbi:MAG: GTP pyrophosphokinase [Myxococcota bacterium]|jgi:GTP pyrophosphokinase